MIFVVLKLCSFLCCLSPALVVVYLGSLCVLESETPFLTPGWLWTPHISPPPPHPLALLLCLLFLCDLMLFSLEWSALCVCLHAQMRACLWMCVCVCSWCVFTLCVCVCTHAYVCVYECVCVRACICMDVCVCVRVCFTVWVFTVLLIECTCALTYMDDIKKKKGLASRFKQNSLSWMPSWNISNWAQLVIELKWDSRVVSITVACHTAVCRCHGMR